MSSDSLPIFAIFPSTQFDKDVSDKNDTETIKNDEKSIIINYSDSLTSGDDKKIDADDIYRNNEKFNVNKTKNGDASSKTSLLIKIDEINKQNNNKYVAQKCRGQKIVVASLERRGRDRVRAKTGYRKNTCCKLRGGVLSMLHVLVAVIIYHLVLIERVSGGICWASIQSNGKCKELTAEMISKENCCTTGQGPGTAWSSEDLESGPLFYWKVLGGGVPCNACRETCSGVQCGAGRRCAIRRGRPRCVCAPKCGGGRGRPVCGTDGRSYRSLCRLRKRACRRRARDLTLDYYGHCQDSCSKIRCGSGRHCLLDQDSRAHCVKCTRSCPKVHQSEHDTKALCGADGVTYASTCHLQAAACKKGKSIPLAYKGPCDRNATCSTVKCRPRQVCLTDWPAKKPRCVSCGARCPRNKRTLCASNNRTYSSWCHMLRDACITGFVLETKHAGTCGADDLNDFNLVSNDEDDE